MNDDPALNTYIFSAKWTEAKSYKVFAKNEAEALSKVKELHAKYFPRKDTTFDDAALVLADERADRHEE